MSTLAWASAITLGQGLLFQGAAWTQSIVLLDSPGRTLALAKILGAVLAEGAMIGVLIVAFRRNDVPLFERPLKEPGRLRAWIVAGGLWLLFALPMLLSSTPRAPVLELSWFNLAGSLLAGPGAGTAEELLFRGLLMSLLARGGWGLPAAIAATSVLFGVAHAGWGLLAGDLLSGLMAVSGTAVLGLVFGLVYALSGRRLLPAVALHAAINLVIEPWLVLAAVQGTLSPPG